MTPSTFSIRLDEDLLNTIKDIAKKETRTVNQQIIYFIEKGLARYEQEQEVLASMDIKNETNERKSAI